MKRCRPTSQAASLSPLARRAGALLLAVAAALSVGGTAVMAQTNDAWLSVRQFPAAAMRGEMVVRNHPVVTLNGKTEQLSPGARIFDQNNLLVLSGQLVNRDVLVNYLRDGGGQIHQVWILNSEEAREQRAGSNRTIFNFVTDLFGSNAPAAPGASAPP
jgi:hypothetical protein